MLGFVTEMPRTYKRSLGSRRYADYSEEKLQECLNEIRIGAISHRRAEAKYGIPRRTILNKLKGKHTNKPGRQNIFTIDEENSFVNCLISMGNFGFPVNSMEARQLIRNYLNRCGREVKIFQNNIPGSDWMKNFIKRHPELSVRFAENVKRTRAAVDENMLRSFFENLESEIADVAPTNLWNFDETNLTDDPGKKKVLVKKGCKYPELIRNASKTSVSIMFSGNAAGELLPPYVVYRATNMWSTWKENGPKGCRYNASPSGWFDANIFNDWLEFQMIPRLKKLQGKKVLLCDNLSSHITVNALQLCRNNDIHLICLPPNSTHLTQPLDVAFFRPLKIAWRKVLSDWKDTAAGMRSTNIQKEHFPPLLAKMMEIITPQVENNLKAGFRKCGIYPLNIEEVLSRIPTQKNCDQDLVQSAFLKHIEAKRVEVTGTVKSRRKKLNIPAGKSVCADQPTSEEDEPEDEDTIVVSGTSGTQNDTNGMVYNDNSSDDVDFEELAEEREKETEFVNFIEGKTSQRKSSFSEVVKEVGRFVAFYYEKQLYPGEIVSFDDETVTINAMQKSLKMWKWPSKKDELIYPWTDVVGSIKHPKQVSNRGTFSVPELNPFCD